MNHCTVPPAWCSQRGWKREEGNRKEGGWEQQQIHCDPAMPQASTKVCVARQKGKFEGASSCSPQSCTAPRGSLARVGTEAGKRDRGQVSEGQGSRRKTMLTSSWSVWTTSFALQGNKYMCLSLALKLMLCSFSLWQFSISPYTESQLMPLTGKVALPCPAEPGWMCPAGHITGTVPLPPLLAGKGPAKRWSLCLVQR